MNRLRRGVLLGAVLATTLVATAARSAQAETIVFTAQLFTSSVVPPDSVSPSERGAFGTAIITLTITRGPGGVVRGQLLGPPSLQFADPIPGVTAQLFPNQTSYVAGDRFQVTLVAGNSQVTQADIFVGLALSAAETAVLCPLTPGDQ